MNIFEAIDTINDYSFYEEQEWEIQDILKNVQGNLYFDSRNPLNKDMDYLIQCALLRIPLIKVLFPNESEKIIEIQTAIGTIRDYKESILIARKLNQTK